MKFPKWMTNREKKRQPRQGRFWCWGCDGRYIYEGQKCEMCGKRNFKYRRNKK